MTNKVDHIPVRLTVQGKMHHLIDTYKFYDLAASHAKRLRTKGYRVIVKRFDVNVRTALISDLDKSKAYNKMYGVYAAEKKMR